MRQLIRNSITTPDGTVLVSRHHHDFVEYTDKNGQYYAIDGGNSYTRILCDKQDYVNSSVYTDDDFEIVRDAFTWGTYGKDGNQPLSHVKLKDMEDAHIETILNTISLSDYVSDTFKKELEYRRALWA